MGVHPAPEFSPLWSSMRCHWESSVYGLSCSVVLFILSFGEVRDHCSQFRERLGPVYSDGPSRTPSYSIVLQCTPLYSSVLQCTQVYSGVLSCTPVYYNVLRRTPVCPCVFQRTPVYSSVLYLMAIHSQCQGELISPQESGHLCLGWGARNVRPGRICFLVRFCC